MAARGQSAGGFRSIYTASKRPPAWSRCSRLHPVAAAARTRTRVRPAHRNRMAELFAAHRAADRRPGAVFYAENDEYIGPRVQKLWFESFRAPAAAASCGGAAVPERRGHAVFSSPAGVPLWTAAVAAFFKSQGDSPYRSRISLR